MKKKDKLRYKEKVIANMFRINCRFFACRDVTEIVWRSVSKSKSFNL